MITVIGLGVEKGGLTERAIAALKNAESVIVRNASPVTEELSERGIAFETLDRIFEKSRNFDSLVNNLVKEITGRKGDICYCVEGGASEDRAARILIEKGACVISGVSKSAHAAELLGIGDYTACSAYELKNKRLALPLIVYDLDDKLLAGDVKLQLTDCFGDEADAYLIEGSDIQKIKLYEADMQKIYTPLTVLAVPEIPLLKKKRFNFDDFVEILKRLRAPDGCPWDRLQTHESIRINAIEEAYELVDAIDLKDSDKIEEEAGDVFMQALFHTLIEEEAGNFNVTDMISGICDKLIGRHTHVFGSDKAVGADGALSVWDKNKMTEKHQTTYSQAVNDVPLCFPALLRAQKISKRIAKGGWIFRDFENIVKKLSEEINELWKAKEENNPARIAEELGDVLMVMAHIAYVLKVDSEQALLDTVKKVQHRYEVWETLVLADGKDVNNLTSEEWDFYYKRMKDATRN